MKKLNQVMEDYFQNSNSGGSKAIQQGILNRIAELSKDHKLSTYATIEFDDNFAVIFDDEVRILNMDLDQLGFKIKSVRRQLKLYGCTGSTKSIVDSNILSLLLDNCKFSDLVVPKALTNLDCNESIVNSFKSIKNTKLRVFSYRTLNLTDNGKSLYTIPKTLKDCKLFISIKNNDSLKTLAWIPSGVKFVDLAIHKLDSFKGLPEDCEFYYMDIHRVKGSIYPEVDDFKKLPKKLKSFDIKPLANEQITRYYAEHASEFLERCKTDSNNITVGIESYK